MNLPDPALWKRVRPLLDEALDRDGDERAAYIAAIADPELRAEVERMVRKQARTAIVDQSAAALAAPAIASNTVVRDWDRDQIGRRLGAFRLVRLIGAGGMGTVYAARRVDGRFDQEVAIKLVLSAHPGLRERFAREQQIVAGLRHPNIAQLLDGGESEDGIPYFAMEYVEGAAITDHVVRAQLDERGIVKLMLRVAAALAYAHRALIVHRDIKPSNILVTADGHPKLLDFGIAKLVGADEVRPITAQRIGPMTPEYAAPEQFQGGTITVATDVYQFGVLLYRLLAGRLPYDADAGDALAFARAVIEREPVPLFRRTQTSRSGQTTTQSRPLRRTAFGLDLEAVLMKALAKSPEARYVSVEALIADLEALLDERPISARRQTAARRAWRFVLRHRVAVALAAAAAFGLMLTTAYALHQAELARREARRAQRTTGFLADMFEVVDPSERRADRLTAASMLERANTRAAAIGDDAAMRGALSLIVARTYQNLGELQRALPVFAQAIAAYREAGPDYERELAVACTHAIVTAARAGRIEDARAWRAEVAALQLPADRSTAWIRGMGMYADARLERVQGRYEHAIELMDQALPLLESAPEYSIEEFGGAVHLRAILLFGRDRFAESRRELDRARALYAQLPQAEQYRVDYLNVTYAAILREEGELDAARELLVAGDRKFRELAGADSTLVAHNLFDLAIVDDLRGDAATAFAEYREAMDTFTLRYGTGSSWQWDAGHRAIWAAIAAGRHDEARALALRLLPLARSHPPAEPELVAWILSALAVAERARGERAAAYAAIDRARRIAAAYPDSNSAFRLKHLLVRADLALDGNDRREAARLLAEVEPQLQRDFRIEFAPWRELRAHADALARRLTP
jgi:serine/threonine-protein kinase